MEQFAKIVKDWKQLTLNLRCLTGFWIRLWSLQLTFYGNLWRRTYRCFINFFLSMSNRTTSETAVKVWLELLCSIKLWTWSLSSIIHETLSVTLIGKIGKMKINSLHRIFWVIEYWYKTHKCQICLADAKTFF